jgi:hypothetical protein
MGRNHDFPLPEMPGVCLTCGARGPLTPTKFVFKHMSKTSAVITALALLGGVLYARQMVYRLQLPVCGVCLANVRRAKRVAVLGVMLFLPAAFVSAMLSTIHELLFLMVFVYVVAALVYYLAVRTRGTPKASRLDGDHLTLAVPGYGEFVVFDRTAAAKAPPAAKPRAPEAPRLNRSVCAGCGFINFPGVAECKKCRAPLGQTVAA